MTEKPSDPTGQDIEREAATRRQFEADVISRQSNALPLDAAKNEGRFYGQLVRGERRLNGTQRIGFFLVGSLFCGSALFIVMGAFPRLFGYIGLHVTPIDDTTVSMVSLPLAALSLVLGLKIIVAAVAHRGKQQKAVE